MVGKSNLKAEGTLGFKMVALRFTHLLGVCKKTSMSYVEGDEKEI